MTLNKKKSLHNQNPKLQLSNTKASMKTEALEPGMVVHTCNPSTQEVEAGGWCFQDLPGLQRETLSQK
jgi:hypothetical protein